jgi:hypothetical protein
MSEKPIANLNLKELRSSGYEMRDGEPDIRGWKVKNSQNIEIGKVDELLFDVQSLRVRYLILDLDGKPLNLVSRDVIIPIGLAVVDKTNELVMLPEVSVGHLASLPDYKKGNLTIATEREVRNVFAPVERVEYDDPDYFDPEEFYNHKYYDQQRTFDPLAASPADNTYVRKTPPTIIDRSDEIPPEAENDVNPY